MSNVADTLELGKVLREWTGSGPCFSRGTLVEITAKTLVLNGYDDHSNAKPGPRRRIKKTGALFHTTPCDRCGMTYGN